MNILTFKSEMQLGHIELTLKDKQRNKMHTKYNAVQHWAFLSDVCLILLFAVCFVLFGRQACAEEIRLTMTSLPMKAKQYPFVGNNGMKGLSYNKRVKLDLWRPWRNLLLRIIETRVTSLMKILPFFLWFFCHFFDFFYDFQFGGPLFKVYGIFTSPRYGGSMSWTSNVNLPKNDCTGQLRALNYDYKG